MTTENETLTNIQIEQKHILQAFGTMIEDEKFSDESLNVLMHPSSDWSFENKLLNTYSGYSCNSKKKLGKVVCIEDDPLVHAERNKTKPGKVFYYPLDLKSTADMLMEQSQTKFNLIWLTFNAFPRFEMIKKIVSIQKLIANDAIVCITFNGEMKSRLTMEKVFQEIIDGDKGQLRGSRVIDAVEDMKEEMVNKELGSIETMTLLIPKILSTMDLFDSSLFYSSFNIDEDPHTTMAFAISTNKGYVKGLQLEAESYFYRQNLDAPVDMFLARNIHNIERPADTFLQKIRIDRYYSRNMKWNRSFNSCPIEEYVFIRPVLKKTGQISNSRVVAKRSSMHSKKFIDLGGNNRIAHAWAPFNRNEYSCKEYGRVNRIENHNNAERRRQRESANATG